MIQLIQSSNVTEEDFEYAASKIIMGTKKNSDDMEYFTFGKFRRVISEDGNLVLIKKIRKKLARSSDKIIPFIESCRRKAD